MKHDRGRCNSCGAEILWIGTEKGKPNHPVQPKRLKIVTDDGTIAQGHESHYAHCPNANQHRTKNGTSSHLDRL